MAIHLGLNTLTLRGAFWHRDESSADSGLCGQDIIGIVWLGV